MNCIPSIYLLDGRKYLKIRSEIIRIIKFDYLRPEEEEEEEEQEEEEEEEETFICVERTRPFVSSNNIWVKQNLDITQIREMNIY